MNNTSNKNNIIGIRWMVTAAFSYSIFTIIVNFIDYNVGSMQFFFFNSLFSLILITFFLLFNPNISFNSLKLKKSSLSKLMLRSILSTIGSILWLLAVRNTTIIEATAISYFTPLLNIIGAMIILYEKVRIRRISAVILGLIGMYCILLPDFKSFNNGFLFAILATVFWSANDILIKHKIQKNLLTQIFYFFLFSTIFLMPLSFNFWHNIEFKQLLLIFLSSVLILINLYCVLSAYLKADLSLIVPFDFCRLVFTSLFAFYIFNEVGTKIIFIGVILILCSTAILAFVEYKDNKLQQEQ